MHKFRMNRICILILMSGVLLGVAACADQTANPATTNIRIYSDNINHNPTYSLNGSFDDNGVAPPPNNGSQNFGHHW